MTTVGNIAADRLRSFIERVERLQEERAALAADIREVFAEAKANGFDTKILRKVIALRKQDAEARQEEAELLDLYMRAVGMDGPAPGRDFVNRQLTQAARLFAEGGTVDTVSAALGVSRATAGRLRQRAIEAGLFTPSKVSVSRNARETETRPDPGIARAVERLVPEEGATVEITTRNGWGVRIERKDGEVVTTALDGETHDPETGEITDAGPGDLSPGPAAARDQSPHAESAGGETAPNVNAAPGPASDAPEVGITAANAGDAANTSGLDAGSGGEDRPAQDPQRPSDLEDESQGGKACQGDAPQGNHPTGHVSVPQGAERASPKSSETGEPAGREGQSREEVASPSAGGVSSARGRIVAEDAEVSLDIPQFLRRDPANRAGWMAPTPAVDDDPFGFAAE